MPKLSEEEKYKAQVRKENHFKDLPDSENEKVIDYMWQRESARREADFEKSFDKYMESKGKKPKETKLFKGQEEVSTGRVFSKKGGREAKSSMDGQDTKAHLGFWRESNPPGGRRKTLPNKSGVEYKLKGI